MKSPTVAPQLGLLREPWSESLGDPDLVHELEEVLLLPADPAAEASVLQGEERLRAVGRELAWTSRWMIQVAESWRAAEEVEAWEDRLLWEAEAVADEAEALALPLLAGEPLLSHLGDGLRAWRLWNLGRDGRQAVVRLLQSLEQSVERIGGSRDAGLALLGELYAAEQALRVAAAELRGLPPLPGAAETLARLTSAVERLRTARAKGAAGAREWREQRTTRRPPVPAPAGSASRDPAIPLPLVALDLLVGETSPARRDQATELLASEVANREQWGDRRFHPQAIASLVIGDLLDTARRCETLERLGREIAAGRAAARVIEMLLPSTTDPSAVPAALDKLVEDGRLKVWEAEAFLRVHRGSVGDRSGITPEGGNGDEA